MGRKFEKNVGVQVGGFEPIKELPPAPEGLRDVGAGHWKRIGDLLVSKSALAEGDLLFLEQLCRAYDEQQQLTEIINREGHTVVDNNGNTRISPIVMQRNRVDKRIKEMLISCAMTPTHHTQIRPLADKEQEEKKEAKHVLKAFTDARTA